MKTNWKELLNHNVLVRFWGRSGFGPLEEQTLERMSPAGNIWLRPSIFDFGPPVGRWYAPHELMLEEDLGANVQPDAK